MAKSEGTIEIQRVGTGFRWKIVSETGQTMSTSEVVPSVDHAKASITWVKKYLGDMEVYGPLE